MSDIEDGERIIEKIEFNATRYLDVTLDRVESEDLLSYIYYLENSFKRLSFICLLLSLFIAFGLIIFIVVEVH